VVAVLRVLLLKGSTSFCWFCYAAYNSPKFNGFIKCSL
jgi:hypothetical protein